jgi:hypothetical protein
MVLAANLSHAAIAEGIRLGRISLKFDNASDSLVDLVATARGGSGASVRLGGTLAGLPRGTNVTLQATVGGGGGGSSGLRRRLRGGAVATPMNLQLVRNNEQTFTVPVPATLPFSFSVDVPLPDGGTDRWRAELHDASTDQIASMTNHVFLASAQPQA